MRHLVLAQARVHRGRYVASALAVVVAVAFVVATLVLGSTVDSAITTSTAAQYDGAAAVITESDPGLDPGRDGDACRDGGACGDPGADRDPGPEKEDAASAGRGYQQLGVSVRRAEMRRQPLSSRG